jgi:serine/threonine-protein kinase
VSLAPEDRWARVKDALSVALKHPGADRDRALDAACGDDPALRADVASLLESREAMGAFLEAPLFGEAPPDGAAATPPELLAWDRYRVLAPVGSGGMATVYRAWDPRLRRTIAVKVISERDATTVARFMREAEAQARVDHDNVLKIFETGTVGPHHYIAMQFVDGATLTEVRAETTIEAKVRLMARIAEGLHAAHRLGLVHRDIKPGNILVERGADGLKPYIADFGLAAETGAPGLTQTGVIVGTPRYMAPERIRRGDAALDRRSDVYSLGATFYEFLTGTPPFGATSGLQVLVDVIERDIAPLRSIDASLPPELDAVVGRCLEKDPQRRYPSARALAEEFERYLNGDPVLARPAGALMRAARKARRHPRLAAAFAVLAIAVGASAGWALYQSWRSARQSEAAEEFGQEVETLSWMFRAAQMSPLHPIEPERAQVRDRIARLERTIPELGSAAFGPGHYALGRGYLTLGDPARALDHLQRAWGAGYRTADTAMALGLAHGEVLRLEMVKAERIDGDRAREARVRELERLHRDPALTFLNDGRSSTIAPSRYVDALMASLRGDLPAAVTHAGEAARQTPWLFEAHLLSAQLLLREAVRLYHLDDPDRSAVPADEADRRYADAEGVAPSALDAHIGRCAVAGFVLHLIGHRLERDPAPAMARADESCGRAARIDPGSADARRFYAEAIEEWANIRVERWGDPGDAYDRAGALAAEAMGLSGGDVDARLTLADVFMNRAWWESRDNYDPRASLDRAIAEHTAVLSADPRNLSAMDNRSQALIVRYRYELREGIDALPSMDRAIAGFEATLRLEPSLGGTFRSLGRAAIERADEQALRGIDPAPALNEVLHFIDTLPPDPPLPIRGMTVTQLRARLDAAKQPSTRDDR